MSNYKPKVTTIGGGAREFTDDEIKGRPLSFKGDSSDRFAVTNPKTWDGLSMRLPTPEMTCEQKALSRLLGMTVILDSTMPDGEMEIRSGASRVRLVNIGKDAE